MFGLLKRMMMKTEATIERGLAENICRTIIDNAYRVENKRYAISCWYSKGDASWNVSVFCHKKDENGERKKHIICESGKGFDFHDAVINLRENYLKGVSEYLNFKDGFAHLFEVDLFLDERDNVARNKVGAVLNQDKSHDDMYKEISEQLKLLTDKFNSISNGPNNRTTS
jgi:hypothetical protein